jgi:uncharacterized RmlC-like cupin family protein
MKVDTEIDDRAVTSDRDSRKLTCRVVDAQPVFIGKQTLLYAPGISAESVGAHGIHLQIVTIAPGSKGESA